MIECCKQFSTGGGAYIIKGLICFVETYGSVSYALSDIINFIMYMYCTPRLFKTDYKII